MDEFHRKWSWLSRNFWRLVRIHIRFIYLPMTWKKCDFQSTMIQLCMSGQEDKLNIKNINYFSYQQGDSLSLFSQSISLTQILHHLRWLPTFHLSVNLQNSTHSCSSSSFRYYAKFQKQIASKIATRAKTTRVRIPLSFVAISIEDRWKKKIHSVIS